MKRLLAEYVTNNAGESGLILGDEILFLLRRLKINTEYGLRTQMGQCMAFDLNELKALKSIIELLESMYGRQF